MAENLKRTDNKKYFWRLLFSVCLTVSVLVILFVKTKQEMFAWYGFQAVFAILLSQQIKRLKDVFCKPMNKIYRFIVNIYSHFSPLVFFVVYYLFTNYSDINKIYNTILLYATGTEFILSMCIITAELLFFIHRHMGMGKAEIVISAIILFIYLVLCYIIVFLSKRVSTLTAIVLNLVVLKTFAHYLDPKLNYLSVDKIDNKLKQGYYEFLERIHDFLELSILPMSLLSAFCKNAPAFLKYVFVLSPVDKGSFSQEAFNLFDITALIYTLVFILVFIFLGVRWIIKLVYIEYHDKLNELIESQE